MEQRQGAIDMMMVLQYLLEDIGTNLDPTCRFSRNTSRSSMGVENNAAYHLDYMIIGQGPARLFRGPHQYLTMTCALS